MQVIFENWIRNQSTSILIFDKTDSSQCLIYEQIKWRVWSWLRMNAGGVPNTCKSYDGDPACWIEVVANGWVIHKQPAYNVWDNIWKRMLIPDRSFPGIGKWLKVWNANRWAYVALACWWGNGSPRRWCIAGLRGWTATLELRHGPNSYGRQQ